MTASNSIGEPDPSPTGEANALAGILLSSLETLATAGHADEACRLAGRACAATRLTDMRTWRKFNALLHRLARHVQ